MPERLSDPDTAARFRRLFPSGLAGADVLDELAPDGWERSALWRAFHPTLEQWHAKRVAQHRHLQNLNLGFAARGGKPETDPQAPEPTLEDSRREFTDPPADASEECTHTVGAVTWEIFSDNHTVVTADARAVDLGSWRGASAFLGEFADAGNIRGEWWDHGDYMRFYMGLIWIAREMARFRDPTSDKLVSKARMREELARPIGAVSENLTPVVAAAVAAGALREDEGSLFLAPNPASFTGNSNRLLRAAEDNLRLLQGRWFELVVEQSLVGSGAFSDVRRGLATDPDTALGETDFVAFDPRAVCLVAADPKINTAERVDAAVEASNVRYVRLGAESGWPQLHAASSIDYPLETVSVDGPVTTARAPDFALRTRLREIVERSHRIAGAWDRLPDLPFVELATWSEADLAWLHEPLDPNTDSAWVRALPKIELHCHLGGFATHGDDLAAVRAAAKTPSTLPSLQDCAPPAGWPRPTAPIGLDRYMRLGDNGGSKLLRDPGCLRRQCELLYDRLIADQVAYAEIRCSPNNYADSAHGRSAFEVLREIRETFQHCMQAARTPAAPFPCHVNLLIIATRKDAGDRSDISRHLALAITAADLWRDQDTCRVVGVDLAGFESTATRVAIFQTDFEAVHRVGLAVTVHAGENDDAEGIWQAVFKLNARRLGHALHLGQSPDLLRAVAERGIGVEMCPFANFQIKGFTPFHTQTDLGRHAPHYPLVDYLRAGVRVTANTDKPGISSASLSDKLLLLAELCPGLTRLEVLRLQEHALAVAFVAPDFSTRLRRTVSRSLPRP